MLFCGSLIAAPQKPVALSASIQADDDQADQFLLTIVLDINEGWHTYGEVENDAMTSTVINLDLPTGSELAGDWNRPIGLPSEKSLETTTYEGQVEFSIKILANADALGKEIGVTVQFQACTDEYCNRPQNKTLGVVIPTPESAPVDVKTKVKSQIFEAPVCLTVDGKPLNANTNSRYPAPALFDVDGDGQAELVVVDFVGRITVHENINETGKGDPEWGPAGSLMGVSDDPIRLSNW